MHMKYNESNRAEGYESRVVWILIGLLAVGIIWASLSHIDQTARGAGVVISSSKVQVIQAIDGGTIEQMKVKEGDHVERGEVLVSLDQTRAQASLKEIETKLVALYAQTARLKAEIEKSSTVDFPVEVRQYPEIMAAEMALFMQKRISQREEQRMLAAAAKMTREEAQLVGMLATAGDVSRADVIRSEKMVNEIESQLLNKQNRYYQDTRAELVKTQSEIIQLEQTRAQRAQTLSNCIIKAPVKGLVKNVRVTTQGGVLRAGEDVMELIPIDEKLIVEVKINPTDIAGLRPGLEANIRFDAYDYTIYGPVNGNVTYVSGDSLKDERSTQSTQPFYRVHVTVPNNPALTKTNKEIKIMPGMTAQVDIRLGNRTILHYLLKPLRKTASESFNER